MTSPYDGLAIDQWKSRTLELIAAHPLPSAELYAVVMQVWEDIFRSGIGNKPFRIGEDLFPAPQIMGFFLHELIPLELAARYPGIWRREQSADEKDLVYTPDPSYSIEIKSSSSRGRIFGNRSYAQAGSTTKKPKSGYYLTINFEKFAPRVPRPQIRLVRFGWLDHADWIGQSSATGQRAQLSLQVEANKLLPLPLAE